MQIVFRLSPAPGRGVAWAAHFDVGGEEAAKPGGALLETEERQG